jgi:UDP-3-O-acyl-N-acetylglucosamine deacetylase
MVEHLLAALAGLEIDNCFVEIDGEEFPGLDGSSQPYVEALQHCGLIVQAKSRERLTLGQTIRVAGDDCWIEARPAPDGHTVFEYRLSFDDDTPIPSQTFKCRVTPSSFAREIAPARTFVTLAQANHLRGQGVASHVTNQDLLVLDDSGPIDNELRFENECARHKTLDLIGDLALAGVDISAHVVSFRGGHSLNGRLAQQLFELAARQRDTTATEFKSGKAA